MDLSLPPKFHGKLCELLKITFLVWCLVPLNFNGSDLLFDYVVAPVHWLITTGLELCRPPYQYLVERLALYVVQPTLETLHQAGTLISYYIMLAVSATPGQSVWEACRFS